MHLSISMSMHARMRCTYLCIDAESLFRGCSLTITISVSCTYNKRNA